MVFFQTLSPPRPFVVSASPKHTRQTEPSWLKVGERVVITASVWILWPRKQPHPQRFAPLTMHWLHRQWSAERTPLALQTKDKYRCVRADELYHRVRTEVPSNAACSFNYYYYSAASLNTNLTPAARFKTHRIRHTHQDWRKIWYFEETKVLLAL